MILKARHSSIIVLVPEESHPEIDALPPLREVISEHNLRAEKSLGQNFLLDQNITDKIVRHADIADGQTVIEVGPGPGGLTRSLLKSPAGHVTAVEFDPRAVGALALLKDVAAGRLEILEQDALSLDVCSIGSAPRCIVANLPYNIATPLLIGWLKTIREKPEALSSMTLMFQKEVAQRIVAAPKSKAYGRLSVMCQWLCDVRKAFDLPPHAFIPAPKVKSSIVHFKPKALDADAPGFDVMEKLLAAAFGQRRKMLRSSLKEYVAHFEEAGISETDRAEDISVEKFIALAKIIARP